MTNDPERDRPAIQDAAIAQYRAISATALMGLFFGLFAWVVLLDVWGWVVPTLGIIFSGIGLWRVSRNPDSMLGRTPALVGLWLSIGFAVAAPTHWYMHGYMVRREATEFAMDWFEYLRKDKPLEIHQLSWHPKYRLPLDETLIDAYREDPEELRKARLYSKETLISRLLSLGPNAEPRYYTTLRQRRFRETDSLYQVFSVTYNDAGRKKTFFMGMTMDRHPLGNGKYSWRVTNTDYGFVPPKVKQMTGGE
ncbi:MAG: hypothetical protein HQ567_33075 [Candidatus Nealsonbacteria bacterium]|nr:hypothetical protein [Candidatus Nealsonbacteria bacterium]